MSRTSANTITIDLDAKTATYGSIMTIRENVGITLVNATGATAAGLILRVLKPDDQAEMAACEEFTADGDNFTGVLDLSGDDLAAEFDGDLADKHRSFIMQVWDNTDGNEILTDKIYIWNNPLTETIQDTELTEA